MGGATKLVVRERRMWVEYKERKEVWVGRIKKRKRRERDSNTYINTFGN